MTLIVVMDMLCVACSFFLALWFRFDLSFHAIPKDYFQFYQESIFLWCLVTIAVFAGFNLYNSVWSFAGENEVVRMLLAHSCLALLGVAVVLVFKASMPRSYYVIGFVLSALSTTVLRLSY